jgi:neurofibromin 1
LFKNQSTKELLNGKNFNFNIGSCRYFTLFMNLMNDCNEAQEMEKDVTRQRMSAGKLNTLRNVTIQAMSNLLSANIDSGLMHSIGT